MLPHVAISPMQMIRTEGLGCKPCAVVNLGNTNDVLRTVLKIQHNDQFWPTSNQTIMVPPGVQKSVLTQKCGDVINTQQVLVRVQNDIRPSP